MRHIIFSRRPAGLFSLSSETRGRKINIFDEWRWREMTTCQGNKARGMNMSQKISHQCDTQKNFALGWCFFITMYARFCTGDSCFTEEFQLLGIGRRAEGEPQQPGSEALHRFWITHKTINSGTSHPQLPCECTACLWNFECCWENINLPREKEQRCCRN